MKFLIFNPQKKGQDCTDFIKIRSILRRNSRITKVIDDSESCYREETLEKSKKVVKTKKLANFFQ